MKQTWKNKWLMLLGGVILLGGLSGCEDRTEEAVVPPADGEEVTVSMVFGFAEDSSDDGASTARLNGSPLRRAVESSKAAFDVNLSSGTMTRGGTSVPDQLYNLEIRQYDSNGTYKNGKDYGNVALGKHLEVTLSALTDCQLLIVARGNGGAIAALGSNSLEKVQAMDVNSSVINAIDPSNSEDMKKMPYVLHLEHVNVAQVDGKYVIQSPEGSYDTRLLLKRLAARLTVEWTYAVSGYTLKQLLLQSVPLNYAVIPTPDSEGNYPSILDQFTTLQIKNVAQSGSYSCWVPTNMRGEKPAANSETQRTKENAPKGSSFFNFVAVSDQDAKVKLDYRVYIGGRQSTNFDIKSNANYDYTVNFAHSGIPTSDKRVTYINPVPASENNENFVPTANCFMVSAGGGFCFDPLAYQQNGDPDKTNDVLKGWCEASGGITSMKLLWQTKEDGDIGEPVMGIVTSEDDHTNIVDLKRTDGTDPTLYPVKNKGEARVYCRVAPGTTGGSGVIAAYGADGKILWSWHVWVTDYRPDATGDADVQEPLTKRKLKFTYGNHGNQLPMMDRNLGAMAGYAGVPPSDVEKFKTHGFHYQWGRKDPYPSSYSNKPITKVDLPSPIAKPIVGILSLYKPDGVTFLPFDPAVNAQATYRTAYQNPLNIYKKTNVLSWIDNSENNSTYKNIWNAPKTVHDPCPAGWRVAQIENYLSLFKNVSQSAGKGDFLANVKNPASLKADGGMILTYDTDGRQSTYIRFTGYYFLNQEFQYIGESALIWCGNTLSGSGGSTVKYFQVRVTPTDKGSIVYGGHEREAIPLRCIQERAD
ncbi:DUF4906 domain-containing protein [Bacteroides hominis]|uniref:DUF4906 domain-containing protein n=1 Tax=Bacteroides hominis TaxID=2763023 RepID=UPI0029499AEB|nr:DUF4906 domain-containing protein [Bacteroides hominis (ex Liu et al. 2022)]MDV6174022.1 DUF4906 domain-containing protein [Bacteroides hominis (ex Liu et al. 2022)]